MCAVWKSLHQQTEDKYETIQEISAERKNFGAFDILIVYPNTLKFVNTFHWNIEYFHAV